mmetsp:Transcript_42306/g.122817  ORF Transcript_42306/g.122817 Transcript_42306/m.122817 type:complete len:224 (+) Transcript_42306:132-803(+)
MAYTRLCCPLRQHCLGAGAASVSYRVGRLRGGIGCGLARGRPRLTHGRHHRPRNRPGDLLRLAMARLVIGGMDLESCARGRYLLLDWLVGGCTMERFARPRCARDSVRPVTVPHCHDRVRRDSVCGGALDRCATRLRRTPVVVGLGPGGVVRAAQQPRTHGRPRWHFRVRRLHLDLHEVLRNVRVPSTRGRGETQGRTGSRHGNHVVGRLDRVIADDIAENGQ